MIETTFSTRLLQLIAQVKNHPHKDEILKLAFEQWVDDTDEVVQQIV